MAEEEFSIHTQTVGDSGEVVVFFAGLFGQGKNFTQIAKGLTPDYQSVLVDLPNHGESDWTEAFDYPGHADLVAEHLRSNAAADGPVHLVGHSLGGKVAMVLALRHPDLVRSLTVVDISPVTHASTGEFEHLLQTLLGLDLDDLSSRGEADKRLKEPIPQDMTRGFLLQSLTRTKDGFRWLPNLELLYESLPSISEFPEFDGEQYQGPVLWVAGSESDYIKDEYATTMRELFPRTLQTTVKNSGHWVHAEQPQVFTEILTRFLSADRD